MGKIRLEILSEHEIEAIHNASLTILRDTGIKVHHDEILNLLGKEGARIDSENKIARLPEKLICDCIEKAGKKYILYGRDEKRQARFGYGDLIQMSSPGQYGWLDSQTGEMREATAADARDAIRLGDALENIKIVGSMAQPKEIATTWREVFLTAELVKGTGKPTRTWIHNGRCAKYVLEIYKAVAGGEKALREKPMIETFLEPISPLQFHKEGLDIVMEFVNAGQSVSIGPMAMTSGTAPGTLAGTLAQENAEILAGVVITQLLRPGTAVTYGGIPHIMDPRTGICSFGSPEQGLMGVAMTQMGKFYGFPVYINVGLTDAKLPDAQAGSEKASTLMLGALAGADMFGHCGICGTDHAGSLDWLVFDNEIMDYVKRIAGGFEVSEKTLATEVIAAVGPGGNFLSEMHTVEHFKREIWLADKTWTRQSFDDWHETGGKDMAERIKEKREKLLSEHKPAQLDEDMSREIDKIVEAAKGDLG